MPALSTLPNQTLPPLGLYIHIPWCVRKCPYCDFNSHEVRDNIPEKAYIQALLADLDHDLEYIYGRQIDSIFIGGGTPSLFSPESLADLLDGLQTKLAFSDAVEITLEANPGTVEQQKFTDFRAAGINRLSIGIQSFNDDMLNRIGRIHDSKAAIKAAEMAHYAGFERINLDLMFGLPGQQLKEALKDLEFATSLQPGHISWYQLTLEPNTLFYQQPPTLPEDDYIWQIQEQGQAFLAERLYPQYEISAYSQDNACRHNLNYWQFGDYLGIGAGAHAKLSTPGLEQIIRQQRCRHPQDYLHTATNTQVISQHRVLETNDRVLEFMMNALRLNAGASLEDFHARTGLSSDYIRATMDIAIQKKLLLAVDGRIQASPHGQQYLNDLLALFMET
jgi:oxygen-independent coproporphyrinogen-3 oxidase